MSKRNEVSRADKALSAVSRAMAQGAQANLVTGTASHQLEAMKAKGRALEYELARKVLTDTQRASKQRILASLAFQIETMALLAHEASTRYHENNSRGANGLPIASKPELKIGPAIVAPSYNAKPKKVWARS